MLTSSDENMKKDDISNKAKKAIDLVSGIDDEFKAAAFSVVFERMLDESDPPLPQHGKAAHPNHDDDSKITDVHKKKEDFAGKCGIGITELDDVLYFADNLIKVVAPLSGSESEKQSIVAKCILTAYDVIFGQTWVKALDLSKCVGESKVGQLNHLAENLQKDKQSFRLQGKLRSAQYKITESGKTSAYEIIKKLAKGETL